MIVRSSAAVLHSRIDRIKSRNFNAIPLHRKKRGETISQSKGTAQNPKRFFSFFSIPTAVVLPRFSSPCHQRDQWPSYSSKRAAERASAIRNKEHSAFIFLFPLFFKMPNTTHSILGNTTASSSTLRMCRSPAAPQPAQANWEQARNKSILIFFTFFLYKISFY